MNQLVPSSNRNLMTLQWDFKTAVTDAIDNGDISPTEAWVYLNQLQKSIATLLDSRSLRDKLRDLTDIEKQTVQGFVISKSNGGAILDYEADHVYVERKYLLDERKRLLDMAAKTREEMYDTKGVMIPKVPIKTYKKDSITVTVAKNY